VIIILWAAFLAVRFPMGKKFITFSFLDYGPVELGKVLVLYCRKISKGARKDFGNSLKKFLGCPQLFHYPGRAKDGCFPFSFQVNKLVNSGIFPSFPMVQPGV